MSLNLSEEEQNKIVYFFTDLIDKALRDNEDLYKTKLLEYWKRYEGDWSCKKNKDYPYEGSADFHVPFTTWAVDATDSRAYNAIFSNEDVTKIKGTTRESRKPAKRVSAFINYYLLRKMDVEEVYSPWFLSSIVEGQRLLRTVPQKIITNKKFYRRSPDGSGYLFDKISKLLMPEKRIKEKTVLKSYDVATNDFIFPSYAADIQSCPWIAERLYLTKYDLKLRVTTEGYIAENVEKVKSKESVALDENELSQYQGAKEGIEEAFDRTDIHKPYLVHGRYQFKESEEEKECIFVIDTENKILLYAGYNETRDSRRPYTMVYHRFIPKRLLGQGMPRRLALMNDEMDTLHNIIIDNSALCNAITYLYVENKGFNPDKVKIKPGAAIPVPSLEGVIKQWVLGNPNLDLHQQENFVLSLLERLSLTSDYNMGRESSQTTRPTARGTAMLLNEFAMNFSKISRNIQRAVKHHILQVLNTLYETLPAKSIYYPEEKGDEFIEFNRADLEYIDDFEIITLGDAVSSSKQIQVNNAVMLHSSLGQDQTGEVNTYNIKKNLVEKTDRNLTSEIMRSPKEIQALQQAQQALQQKAATLRQKEIELEGRDLVSGLREQGASEQEIQVEVNKWKQEIQQEEAEANK